MIEDVRLLSQAVSEMADQLGDSVRRPVSLALALGDMGGTWETFSKILSSTNLLVNTEDVSEYSIDDFRKSFAKVDPLFADIKDLYIVKIVNALAQEYIEELYMVSKKLTYELDDRYKIPY